jgi:hypothetical protein
MERVITHMMRISGKHFWDAIISTNPLIFMIVCFHEVVKEVSSLVKEFGEVSTSFFVFWIFFYMHELKDYTLAHSCTLDTWGTMVVVGSLIFFYGLSDTVFEELTGCGVLETEDSFDALACG